MAESKVSMKLLIDTKGKRVLFAEASKDCVDFLFNILSLPVATIVRLLKADGMAGSLPNLYKSLENLDDDYILFDENKDIYLKPASCSLVPLLALNEAHVHKEKVLYKCCNSYCSSSSTRASDDPTAVCPSCYADMSKTLEYVAPPAVQAALKGCGPVIGVVTYMVMDDLEVKPMSTISTVTLLNHFNVQNVGALKEKVVNLGMKEGLKLLKASLQSKNVLTDVFC